MYKLKSIVETLVSFSSVLEAVGSKADLQDHIDPRNNKYLRFIADKIDNNYHGYIMYSLLDKTDAKKAFKDNVAGFQDFTVQVARKNPDRSTKEMAEILWPKFKADNISVFRDNYLYYPKLKERYSVVATKLKTLTKLVDTLPEPNDVRISTKSLSVYLVYPISEYDNVLKLLPEAKVNKESSDLSNIFKLRISDHTPPADAPTCALEYYL